MRFKVVKCIGVESFKDLRDALDRLAVLPEIDHVVNKEEYREKQ
jgi:hypothetical protein